MLRYVLIRSLLIIPTLIVVSIIAFVLSRMASGDMVEQRLELQGISIDEDFISSERYYSEYENLYKKLHQDKPIFYFTISPHVKDINQIVDPIVRKRMSGMMKNRYSEETVYAYNIELSEFLKALKTKGDQSREVSDLVTRIESQDEQGPILKTFDDMASFMASDKERADHKKVNSLAEELKIKQVFLPKFRWHGIDNQYHRWASNFVVGNFGYSIRDGKEVSSKIWGGMKWTLALIILNFILAIIIAIPLGIYNGINKDSLFDKVSNAILFSFYAIPVFWLATLLIVFFSTSEYGMNIFPSVGFWNLDEDASLIANMLISAKQLILPTICITLIDLVYLSRLVRGDIIKESEKPYAQAVTAKGLSQRQLGYNHLMPNALTNVTTLIIGSIPISMAGTLIIEVIFNIPGMGRLMYDSIFVGDWSIVFGVLMVIAVLTLIFYLIGDILYALINPKITLS